MADDSSSGGEGHKKRKSKSSYQPQSSVDTRNTDDDNFSVTTRTTVTHNRRFGATANSSVVSVRRPQPQKQANKRVGKIPPLHLAAERGEADKVRKLLSRGGEDEEGGISISVHSRDPEDDGNTPLHVAARAGHAEVANLLLEYGAKIESRNKYNDTCLHVAAANGQIRVVRFFLERDIKIEMRGNHNFTALHSAAESGQPATCKFLIVGGANIEAQSIRGDTPLHVAAFMGETGAMKMLLRMGARVEARNKMLETPLHRCCASGKYDAVRLLFQRKADLEVRQKYGWTLLHTAASNGQIEIVRLLLELRADIDAQDYNGNAPLHVACFFGKTNVVQLLLSKHADIEAQDCHGRTPLHLASWCGARKPKDHVAPDNSTMPIWLGYARTGEAICSVWQTKLTTTNTMTGGTLSIPEPNEKPLSNASVVRTLLNRKANFLAKSMHMETALHFAATTGQFDSCKLLLKNGARLDDRAEGGRTLLHMVACGVGLVDVGTLLIERSCPVDAHDKFGDTPLSLACKFGKMDYAMLLLQHGANATALNHKTGEQNAPIHLAAENGHVNIVQMLLSLAIDGKKVVAVDSLNGTGDTALARAAAAGQHGTAWLLLSSGASVNLERSLVNKKQTPLHAAAENGHLDVARLLLDHKADIAATDVDGRTALHLAAANGHTSICRLMISDFNAETEAVDNNGRSPLHLAAQSGQFATVSMLLSDADANAELRDTSGNIPLHCVCDRFKATENDLKTIRIFIEEPKIAHRITKMLRARNNNGETPLGRYRNVVNKTVQYIELLRLLSTKS